MACTFSENLQIIGEPYVTISEQPASIVRFRYESEERNAGLLPGASSTSDTKTFPSIQVVGYKGRAAVLVSLVTAEEPYRPHPHSLVGKDCCSAGVCFLQISPDTMSIQFRNLKIQCVKKKDINQVLKQRKIRNIDPFKTGFNYATPIDTTTVRLCFQVFLEGNEKGKCNVPLTPVVSDPIVDKRTKPDLVIVEMSDCVSRVDGDNKKIILLCEKIAKDDDIEVRFYEEKNGKVVWEGFGDFPASRVHKHVAISFHPPRYHNLEISDPVNVFVQMRRPSDGTTSDSLPFQFLPGLDRKRKRQRLSSFMELSQQIEMRSSSVPEYQMNRTSHTSMDIEEDIKGVFALSRVPDPQETILDPPSGTYKHDFTYQIAQEESIEQLAQASSENTPSTSGQKGTSAIMTQCTYQNTAPTVQMTQITPQNTQYGIIQTNPQNTATTNSVHTVPSVIMNHQNEIQIPHLNSIIQNASPEINHNNASDIQNVPSNQVNPLVQPTFINFQNTPAAISQLTQAILQNIPSIINQLTQSSFQITNPSSFIQNSIGNHPTQTSPEIKPSIDTNQNISPTINSIGQSTLHDSPSSRNQSIQFTFQNTSQTSNPQVVPSTNHQHILANSQTTGIASSSLVLVDPQQWNIPLTSKSEECGEAANSEKTVPDKLKIIWDGIRNSELEPIIVNSGELGSFEGAYELNNLSEDLSNNLSITDMEERPHENMSDSLTRLVDSTAENLCPDANKFW